MKKQLRKGLSLFLAVMMLMSAWVWVAPEKAEAVSNQYYIKYIVYVTDDWNNGDGKSYIRVGYRPNNGQDGETYATFTQASGFWNNSTDKDYIVIESYIDGFPTYVWQHAGTSVLRTMEYSNARLYVGTNPDNCTTLLASGGTFKVGSNKTVEKTVLSGWSMPTFIPDRQDTVEINVPKLTSNAFDMTYNSGSAVVTSGKDNYGAVWTASIPNTGYTYSVLQTEGGSAVNSGYATVTGTGKTATINIYAGAQRLTSGGASSSTLVLQTTYGGKTITSTIKLNHPTYDITFNSNGGLIGSDSSSAGETVTISGKYYDGVIGNAPAYAYKEGMDFLGFYKDKKSDSSALADANYTGAFEDGVTAVDAVGDRTWYAAWQAKPVTATFKNADGQVIGTLKGRWNTSLRNLY
ncbi:MAG: hypothetical protein ACI4XE_08620, partial [Acutalibacteraceae bacterium]